MDIISGSVIGRNYRRHRSAEFLRFLKEVEAVTPRELDLHLVLDNYATHKTPTVKAWLLKLNRHGFSADSERVRLLGAVGGGRSEVSTQDVPERPQRLGASVDRQEHRPTAPHVSERLTDTPKDRPNPKTDRPSPRGSAVVKTCERGALASREDRRAVPDSRPPPPRQATTTSRLGTSSCSSRAAVPCRR